MRINFSFPHWVAPAWIRSSARPGNSPGDVVTADTGDGLLPLSADANDTHIADISGPDGVLSSPTDDGTHIAVNIADTPLQGALI